MATDVCRSHDGVAADDDDRDQVSGVGGEVGTNRRRRHRRGKSKKRKWKPYNKLTWEEKRELEDREARRANRIRAERFAHGQPVAPYNTTQFLMEDHNVQEPDLENHRQHRESTGTLDSDEYYYSSPEDEEEFLQKEFCVVYDSIHAERLSSMTKLELIQEYMQLEDRVEKLEQKLKSGSCGSGSGGGYGATVARDRMNCDGEAKSMENLEKIRIFQQEMLKLAEENERLRRENCVLKEVRCTYVDGDGTVSGVEPMDNLGEEVDERLVVVAPAPVKADEEKNKIM